MAYRIEGRDIVIDGFENGISPSPYGTMTLANINFGIAGGLADTSYGNIVGIPGEFSVQFPLITAPISGITATVNILLVGGGGGGGANAPSNGGGGGQVTYDTSVAVTPQAYTIVVGAAGTSSAGSSGGTGGTSTGIGKTALGGAGGSDASQNNGAASGSGNAGGAKSGNSNGGSGGDGAVGGAASAGVGGNGGVGTSNSITGSAQLYGAGGGGGSSPGGTNGSTPTSVYGGGGQGQFNPAVGQGGVVIISYVTGSMVTTGGTVTTNGANTVVTFTSGGTFTVVSLGLGADIPIAGCSQTTNGVTTATYMMDSTGRVFQNSVTTNTASAAWVYKGIVVASTTSLTGSITYFNGYLLAIFDTIMYYSSNSGATWTSFQTGIDASSNDAFIAPQNDTLYFCNGSAIGSLAVVPGQTFNPATSTTYTYISIAVVIPTYDQATSLTYLGTQVLIGAASNAIYPWDTLSAFPINPLFTGTNFAYAMVTVNNNVYIFTGNPSEVQGRGRIYITNGSAVDVYMKMPDSFVAIGGNSTSVQEPYWLFGDAIYWREQIFFGAVAYGNITGEPITDTGGLWAIDLGSQALYRALAPIAGNTALPTVILADTQDSSVEGLGLFVGSGIGMDTCTSSMSTNPTARIITDKIPAGQFLTKKTYENVEVKLAIPMVGNETIAVTAITDTGSTLVGTMDSTYGVGGTFTVDMENSQWIQIQLLLTGALGGTYCRVREIRLR